MLQRQVRGERLSHSLRDAHELGLIGSPRHAVRVQDDRQLPVNRPDALLPEQLSLALHALELGLTLGRNLLPIHG